MYSIHSCPAGQPLGAESASPAGSSGLVLHLRENRSSLSQEARTTFTVLIGLFMAMAILPALKGEMLVPIYALGTMTLLVGAIEWHQRSQPADEWLAIEADRLSWRSNRHHPVSMPPGQTRLVQDSATPASLRLFLESRPHRIEIGRCLGLEEKRAVAVLIDRQLKEVRA